jgi:hypothetical protein
MPVRGPGGPGSRLYAWVDRIRTSKLAVSIGAMGLFLAWLLSTAETMDKLFVAVGIRPDALATAENDRRANFSRAFIHSAWLRLYLMRRVLMTQIPEHPQDAKDKEWEGYKRALDSWNADLMINILGFQEYYGTAKRREFEHVLQPDFAAIHTCLEAMRSPELGLTCTISHSADRAAIERAINHLNGKLYCFMSGVSAKGQSCAVGGPQK